MLIVKLLISPFQSTDGGLFHDKINPNDVTMAADTLIGELEGAVYEWNIIDQL